MHAPQGALRWQFARSSGPGGQNVNKINSKAEIWVPIESITGLTGAAAERLRRLAGGKLTRSDEIHIASDSHRTQEANRAAVLERLRQLLVEARHEPKRRRKTRPTRASKERRLESKRHRSRIKAERREG